MIITIDGPSGTGKTTVAKNLADHLGFDYFDTGAMYRAVAYCLDQKGIDPNNESQLLAFLDTFDVQMQQMGSERRYFVAGEDVTQAIRSQQVSLRSSQLSQIAAIRAVLVKLQRGFAKDRNVVFEGRDMGTVVFPKAEYKIFLTARPEVRAERRCLQNPEQGDYPSVLKSIQQRDEADQTRKISPLRQAEDAHLIDTSDMTLEEVLKTILRMMA